MRATFSAALIGFALAAPPAGAGGDGGLRVPLKIPITTPPAATSGDFDGDGLLDMAAVDGSQSHIVVLLKRTGRRDAWERLDPFKVGNRAFFLRAGDFNRDGLDDLSVADLEGIAHVVLAIGGGLFGEPFSLREANVPRWTTHGDFDGDANLDIATASRAGLARVFLGLGDGTFKPGWKYFASRGGPHAIEALDYDGDGRLDLAAGVPELGLIPFAGREDGEFEAKPIVTLLGSDAGLRYLATGDFNGDGKGDLATSASIVGLSAGDGTFRVAIGGRPAGVICPAIGDWNGDGSMDAAFADFTELRLHPGNGDGTFQPVDVVRHSGRFPYFAHARDLDRDGRDDIVVADIDASQVTVYRGTSGETPIETGLALDPPAMITDAALADMDGNGRLDFLFSAAGAQVLIHLNPGAPEAPAPIEVPVARILNTVEAADVDADGVYDLAGTDLAAGRVFIARLDRSFKLIAESSLEAGDLPRDIAAGRIDPGETVDLAVACAGSSHVAVFLGLGGGAFAPAKAVPSVLQAHRLALADLDGDGATDLVVAGKQAAAVHHGAGGGEFTPPVVLLEDVRLSFTAILAAELTDDGLIDIAAGEAHADSLLLFAAVGPGKFGLPEPAASIGAPRSIAAADMDMDGRADLLSAHWDTKGVGVTLAAAGGTFQEPSLYQAVEEPSFVLAGDMDADGALDVIAGGGTEAAILFGYASRPPAPRFRRGDANADGRVQLTDAVAILQRLFQGGDPLACDDAGDADDDGELALTDALYTLLWLFQGGKPLPRPGPVCGEDQTTDGLTECAGGC